jgi:hypothetical protein
MDKKKALIELLIKKQRETSTTKKVCGSVCIIRPR